MKTTFKIGVTAMLMTGGLFAESIPGREIRQQERIGQGVRSGELTRGETRFVENRERSIDREARHDRLTGGGLNSAERERIAARQNHVSQEIYALKHNARDRW